MQSEKYLDICLNILITTFITNDKNISTMKKLLFIFFWIFIFTSTCAQTAAFSEEIVSVKIADGTLEGTLITPIKAEKCPVVLIIAGSGPTDRDCNSAAGLKTNSFKKLAEELANQGIASLRYDKRFVGKSKVKQNVADVTFDDYVNDAIRWLDTLKMMDKSFNKIIVAGHSEGSLVGMLAVQKMNIDAYISVCGPAQTMDAIILEQINKQAPVLTPQLAAIYDKWRRGEKADTIPPMLMSVANPFVRKFMISQMNYIPKIEISKVKIPILIVSGKNDIQVLPKEAEALFQGNPKAQIYYFENMTHVLKDGDTNLGTLMKTYNNPDLPLTLGLSNTISDFIKKLK